MTRKSIIAGFFIASILLTILSVYGVSTYKKPVEIDFNDHKVKIDDSDAEKLGYIIDPTKRIYKKYSTKTTRTKKLFGWDTKVDTTVAVRYVYESR